MRNWPVDSVLSLIVGLLLGLATPGLKDIYRRFISTKVRARLVSTPTVTSIEPTMVVEDFNQSVVDDVQHYLPDNFKRYIGYVEVDNVKGHDILRGCEIIIAVCDPIVFSMSRLRTPIDGLTALRPLPHKVITKEGTASATAGRVNVPISVATRLVCATFAFVANTRYARPFTIHWRVIADSLPHPRATFGTQTVRLGSSINMSQELQERAEALSASINNISIVD